MAPPWSSPGRLLLQVLCQPQNFLPTFVDSIKPYTCNMSPITLNVHCKLQRHGKHWVQVSTFGWSILCNFIANYAVLQIKASSTIVTQELLQKWVFTTTNTRNFHRMVIILCEFISHAHSLANNHQKIAKSSQELQFHITHGALWNDHSSSLFFMFLPDSLFRIKAIQIELSVLCIYLTF